MYANKEPLLTIIKHKLCEVFNYHIYNSRNFLYMI